MKNIPLLLLFLLIAGLSNAQKNKSQIKVADNFFNDYAYFQATELYLAALKKGDTTEHVLSRLGDCYYNNSNVQLASFWYKKAVTKYNDVNTKYLYKYIQTLRSLNQFEEAKKWTKIFKDRNSKDRRVKDEEVFNIEKYEALQSTERVYVDLENIETNTEYSDFGAYEKDDILYFASSRIKDSITDEEAEELYLWNKEPFLDIYQTSIERAEGETVYGEVVEIASNDIDSEIHEASIAITQDGKTLYFTRGNVTKKNKASYDREGTSHLRLLKASLKNGKWTNVVDLPFNAAEYSNGSPALSPDDKTLYFASDMPGSIGQTDIYKVNINKDGTYGNPINMGRTINTEGRENFPFIAKDSTLYFSSDANINLGLLDIFESNILKRKKNDTTAVYVKNLGAPYNSGFDDFAYTIDSETERGYLSSNREGGMGGDDIYSFGKFECKQSITGIAKNKISLEPLKKVVVKLMDESGKILEMITTDETGTFKFEELGCDQTYTIVGENVMYRPDRTEVTTTATNGDNSETMLFLSPLIVDGEIVINPIFFDYNKYEIRPDAAYELENVVAVMREHTSMIIKIEAHTDSRGRDAYNEKLSDRRAKATRDYVFSRGIDTNRIESAIGYGEAQLINHCKDGVKCSDEEHQKNRRSKFIITKGYGMK